MIKFKNIKQEIPYSLFFEKYKDALNKNQSNIEAVSISSFNITSSEVDSRFVNLKIVDEDKFIFFSNYSSPKSIAFDSHNQISACFYWPSINMQIRMKARISRTSKNFNQQYFNSRSENKNALAISSNQSSVISSYDQVIEKYKETKSKSNLSSCPSYWGGFSFTPYEIEFWEGHKFRLNKRDLYKKVNNEWKHLILEP